MSGNPIRPFSNDYTQILADLNSDSELIDKPGWFKRMIAGIGDTISVWLNAIANNRVLRTVFTRSSAQDLLQLIDYFLSPQSTGTGTEIFYLNSSVIFPVTFATSELNALSVGSATSQQLRFEARDGIVVNAFSEPFTATPATDILTVARVYMTGEKVRLTTTGTLPAGLSTGTDYFAVVVSDSQIRLASSVANAFAGIYIDITSAGTGTHTAALYSFQKVVFQQTAQTNFQTVGTSDGSTPFQQFDFPDVNILRDTVQIVINSLSWSRVDTLVFSSPTDRVFRLLYKSNGVAYAQFGNGVYGAIPGAFDVTSLWAVGGGQNSNVLGLNKIANYTGGNSNITGSTNGTTMVGGNDPEAIETAKVVGPLLLKARSRFVTTSDGLALSLTFGGIALVKVNRNYFGPLSVQILGVPNGGGFLSTGQKSDLTTFLVNLTILESVEVAVQDHTQVVVNPNISAKLLPGYAWLSVQPFLKLAALLLITDVGFELQSIYKDSGIVSAIQFINSKWGFTFLVSDGQQIAGMLQNLKPANFGKSLQASDALGFIEFNTTGIDFVVWNSPSLPVLVSNQQITVDGTVTTAQIP